jgi:hypothetical protein
VDDHPPGPRNEGPGGGRPNPNDRDGFGGLEPGDGELVFSDVEDLGEDSTVIVDRRKEAIGQVKLLIKLQESLVAQTKEALRTTRDIGTEDVDDLIMQSCTPLILSRLRFSYDEFFSDYSFWPLQQRVEAVFKKNEAHISEFEARKKRTSAAMESNLLDEPISEYLRNREFGMAEAEEGQHRTQSLLSSNASTYRKSHELQSVGVKSMVHARNIPQVNFNIYTFKYICISDY